jgi:ribosomal protein S27E
MKDGERMAMRHAVLETRCPECNALRLYFAGRHIFCQRCGMMRSYTVAFERNAHGRLVASITILPSA